ncbi:MAG: hypothetical protein WBE38_11650, partial [Terracidiphilus sp.]
SNMAMVVISILGGILCGLLPATELLRRSFQKRGRQPAEDASSHIPEKIEKHTIHQLPIPTMAGVQVTF